MSYERRSVTRFQFVDDAGQPLWPARESVTPNPLIELMHAAEPLIALGYRVSDYEADDRSFGDAALRLVKGSARVRAVRDHDQWFVDVGSATDPNEWFDARFVLDHIGVSTDTVTSDKTGPAGLLESLAATASRWEPLFTTAMYRATRSALRSKEIASARERFGYPPED
jgi:hypothetical protein